MSNDKYNEIWDRKKRYLIRSLFQDLPDFSTIPEEFYSSEASSTSPRLYRSPSPRSYRSPSRLSPRTPKSPYKRHYPRTVPQSPGRYSPLPPLIIEREPNKHDEPEEYYLRLERKVKKIYRKLFLNDDTSISSVGDKLTMVDEEIGEDINGNNHIAVDHHFTIDDDVEVSDDRHNTIEAHDEDINVDNFPNEHEVTFESDEWTTIDEEVVDNDDNGPYTEDRVEQNADHLLQDDANVSGNLHSSQEITVNHFSLNRQQIEITGQSLENVTVDRIPLNVQHNVEVIHDRHSPKEVTVDHVSLNRQDEAMIDDRHSPEVSVNHHYIQEELAADNLENVDMYLTLIHENPDNESSTDIEPKSTTSMEDHESNTMSSVEDHVPENPVSEDNEAFVNLEVNIVSDDAHHIEDIEVMRTARHDTPCSPHAANPSQSLDNSVHFDHEFSKKKFEILNENRNIPELDQSTPFDILRLSSPKNYFENATSNFENLGESSNGNTNFGNMGGRYRASNVGIQTVDHVEMNMNILNDNLFIGSPKVFKLCYCTNHVCGN